MKITQVFPVHEKIPKRVRAAGFFILGVFNIMEFYVFFHLYLGILNYTRAVTGITRKWNVFILIKERLICFYKSVTREGGQAPHVTGLADPTGLPGL